MIGPAYGNRYHGFFIKLDRDSRLSPKLFLRRQNGKTVRKGSRLRRIYDSPQTSLDRLLKLQATSKTIDRQKVEAYQALRAQLDPFRLAQIVQKKLVTIWELAHYRPEVPKKKSDSLKGLSQTEQQALKELSKAFGIKVIVRPRKGADLVVINHG
jgi:hypothetical protein